MLYTKVRYADVIRKLYRLRHLLVHDRHPDISSRLGYKKYSKYYYFLKQKLLEEGILNRKGSFIDTPTNTWIAELPMHIENKIQLRILGNKSSFMIFLALALNENLTLKEILNDLPLSRKWTYESIRKLENASLIINNNSIFVVNKKAGFYSWLSKYMEICILQADTRQEISLLFDFVPGYIDGPQAFYLLNYEAGRPVGPSDMIIRSYKPYQKFWKYVVSQVQYFNKYKKKIVFAEAKKEDELIRMEGIPYNKKAKEELET